MLKEPRTATKSDAIKEYLAQNKDASPRQVVEALKEKGIEVSLALVGVVKYGKPGKKKAKRSRRPSVVETANGKPAVTGSELIRQFIAKNPKAGPKEIESGLKKEGVSVKLSLINAVKYAKGKRRGRRAGRTPVVQAAARATRTSALSVEQLIEVKQFANSVGGLDQVRAALDALVQLQ